MARPLPLLASLLLAATAAAPALGQIWPTLDFFTKSDDQPDITWKAMAGRQFDRFPGGYHCGNWHHNYSQLHRLIRTGSEHWHAKQQEDGGGGEPPPDWRRFVTFSCGKATMRKCGGLGDMLLGIVSTFLVALLQNRAFVIDHPLLQHAFEPNLVDWRMSDDVPMAATISIDKSHPPDKMSSMMADEVPGAVVDVDLLNFVPDNMEKFFDPLHEAGNLRIRWNRGVLTKLLLVDLDRIGGPRPGADHWTQVLHELGLRLPTAFGCLVKYLLRPKPQIYRLAEEEFQAMDEAGVLPTSSICIHVRTPDELTWDSRGEREREDTADDLLDWAERKVLSCAQRIEDFWFHVPPQDVRWVFISSSQVLKKAVKRSRREKVYITESMPTHTALRRDIPGQALSFKVAATDWLVYSRCSLYLMTESGFSKTAALYSGHPFSIFLLARKHYASKRNEWHDECQPLTPASYTLLGARWSGI